MTPKPPETPEEATRQVAAAFQQMRDYEAEAERARAHFGDVLALAQPKLSFRRMGELLDLDPAHLHRTASKSPLYATRND